MADSSASPRCARCGEPLDEYDIEHRHGTCHACRSPKGKIADLSIAIRAPVDAPSRISEWPGIQHLLRERFGRDRSDEDLWERCTGWLRAEGGLEPNDYLPLRLAALVWLLRNDFVSGFREELERIQRRDTNARAARRRAAEEGVASLEKEQRTEESTAGQGFEPPTNPVDETPGLTLLDRFPATPAGHIAFLEWVRDEIHFAAEGKRNQFAEKYSNDTIASMVRGRDALMAEAAQRIATLSELPAEVVRQVTRVLRRELTPGTVERIDELLTPAVKDLRDAWEDSKCPSSAIEADETPRRQGESDAETPTERERVHRLLQAFAEAMQEATDSPEYRAAQEAERQQWHELAGAIREAVEAAGDEVESRNLDRPETRKEWEILTRSVEARAEAIETGNLTAREIFACALAWADWKKIKAEPGNQAQPDTANGAAAESESEPALDAPTKFPRGWLGDVELAEALGVHSSRIRAFRAKLRRMRVAGELSMDDWKEIDNRKRNEPQFLYRANATAIVEMARRHEVPK